MRGYILRGEETNRLGCAVAFVWLPLSSPFFALLLLSSGGCEAKPQPCEPKNWPIFAFMGFVLLLGISTAWTVNKLRYGTRGKALWIAWLLAVLLVTFATFVAWLLTQL